MKKTLVLCADDFSLNPSINAGILSLLDQQRLSAVSCMTQSPAWTSDARTLEAWKSRVDIGLHFNLTQPFPEAVHYSLPALMLTSQLHLVNRNAIRHSLRTQLDRFEQALSSAPDFIDGHQHVHIFPVIRDIVLDEYQRRYGTLEKKPWLRSLQAPSAIGLSFKMRVLQSMGADTHSRLLKQYSIPHNNGFAGIYDFNPQENLDQRMQQWLSALPEGGLIMCHPALENKGNDDVIAAARVSEYKYFCSDRYGHLLEELRVNIGRNKRSPTNNTAINT